MGTAIAAAATGLTGGLQPTRPMACPRPRAPRSSSSDFAPFIPGFLHWVRFCNNGEAAAAAGEFLDLTVGGRTVGYLQHE